MPPRQGQSQLISPVSGLNAPCCSASSSSAAAPSGVSACVVASWSAATFSPASSRGGCWAAVASTAAAFRFASSASLARACARSSASLRFSSTIRSIVGLSASEKAAGTGTEWSGHRQPQPGLREKPGAAWIDRQTFELVCEHLTSRVPVHYRSG